MIETLPQLAPLPSELPAVEREAVIPSGFLAAGGVAGIKASGRPDLAIIATERGRGGERGDGRIGERDGACSTPARTRRTDRGPTQRLIRCDRCHRATRSSTAALSNLRTASAWSPIQPDALSREIVEQDNRKDGSMGEHLGRDHRDTLEKIFSHSSSGKIESRRSFCCSMRLELRAESTTASWRSVWGRKPRSFSGLPGRTSTSRCSSTCGASWRRRGSRHTAMEANRVVATSEC